VRLTIAGKSVKERGAVWSVPKAPGSVIKIAKGLAPCSAVLRESVKPVAQEENAIWTVTTLTPRSVSKPVLMAPAISSAQQ